MLALKMEDGVLGLWKVEMVRKRVVTVLWKEHSTVDQTSAHWTELFTLSQESMVF